MFSSLKKVCAVVVVSLFLLQGGALASSNWGRTQEGFKVWDALSAAGTATASTWSGAVDAEGYAAGKGVLKWFKGKELILTYEGMLLKGKSTGKGLYRYPDGSGYEGNLVNGTFKGKGVFTLPGGYRYEGDFVDDLFNGKGVETSQDGTRYEGDFADGQYNGRGVLTDPKGVRVEGIFEKGRLIKRLD